MHPQYLELKKNLAEMGALVNGHAAMMPEHVAAGLKKRLLNINAILVASEALAQAPEERRFIDEPLLPEANSGTDGLTEKPDTDDSKPLNYARTGTEHVYQSLDTGKFHWEDEANTLDTTPYDTEDQAKAALDDYAAHFLSSDKGTSPDDNGAEPDPQGNGAQDDATGTKPQGEEKDA